MSGPLLAILILSAIMAGTIVVAVIAMRRVGARAEGRADELRDEVERLGEEWIVPLLGAEHHGGRHPHVRGKGHGVLGLTGRRLVFLPIAGERLNVPAVRITAARLEDRRRDAVATHRHRLVFVLDDGAELEFLVDDPAEWARAMTSAGVPVEDRPRPTDEQP